MNTSLSEIPRQRILIIDDEENMRHMLKKMLQHAKYEVETAEDGSQGIEWLKKADFDFVLCDLKMPKMDGLSFLQDVTTQKTAATIIMMSAYGSIDSAIEAMQLGAYDFISKPFKNDEVLLTIRKAEEREQLKRENQVLKEQLRRIEERHQFGKMVAKSPCMHGVFSLITKASQYNITVLVTGESGTGKELVAHAIHRGGFRKDYPLVTLNCGSIPDNLLESELFGYVKGAFTGATENKKGLLEQAHRGTVFLDEIGELPLALQVKLLRVLQESEIRPVGAAYSRKIDVRVIAATSRHLEKMVSNGDFREDLFYRLNVLRIEVPPLRDRNEDIPLLVHHFIKQLNETLDLNIKGVTPTAMVGLLSHQWPGNVRELENAIERAMVLSEGEVLNENSFTFTNLASSSSTCLLENIYDGFSLKYAQKLLEKEMITKALRATDGNRTQAAKLLEISHPSLLSKIKNYELDL